MLKRRNITKNILPTNEFGRLMLNNYIRPSINITTKYLKKSSPTKYELIKLFFRRQIKELNTFLLEGYVSDIFNPRLFSNKARYVIYLLQKD